MFSPGEEPCDEADACCKQHDECVGEASVLDSECHADFLACLDQVMLSGSKGFSKKVRDLAAFSRDDLRDLLNEQVLALSCFSKPVL
jgi:hypothetical protein